MGDVDGDEGGVVFVERFGWKHSAAPPDPASFSEECLSSAEEAAEGIVNCVQATLDSEETRRDVIDFIQRLIQTYIPCQVFPYGSVPLKTYLPDGDIDLTILRGPNAEESLPRDVLAILEAEAHNEYAEYQVKDIQFIDAEVKLVKCLVRDIVVDISFNQIGGLSTLCFLEQVDRIVAKNHIFKRSIILVKSWCYHESRILGAHHGLISTYALETLVLCIFHMFHASLSGPLAVLYKFLHYYSQFDWENYCISLKGPVRRSSLPDIVVNMPENGGNGLMLSEEFLENCMEMFSVPLRELEDKPKPFQAKFLNIIDPLKENNNLGRSVHRGNFYRIRSAFKYGARKLGRVLLQPRDKVADGVRDIFRNTLARHGNHQRNSAHHLSLELGDEESLAPFLPSQLELSSEDDMLLKSSVSDIDDDIAGADDKLTLISKNKLDRCLIIEDSEMASETRFSDVAVSGNCSGSLSSSSFRGCTLGGKFGFSSGLDGGEKQAEMNDTYEWCINDSRAISISGSASSTPKSNIMGSLSLDFREMDLASIEESDAFNPLADLSGDHDSHIRSLLYGQLCNGYSVSASLVHNPPSFSSGIQCKKPWDIVRESMPLGQNQTNSRTFSMEQSFYPAADFALPAIAFHSDQELMARGTGTYFPHMNGFFRERPSPGRGRRRAPGNHNLYHRYARANGVYLEDPNCSDQAMHEIQQHARSRSSHGRGRSDLWGQSPHSVGDTIHLHDNESCRIEFGSVGELAQEVIAGPTNRRGSTSLRTLDTQGAADVLKQERVSVPEIMHLKSEEEFPPLCPLNA